MKNLLLLKRFGLFMVMLLALAMPNDAKKLWEFPVEWDGDVNRDGNVNIADVADLIDALLAQDFSNIYGDVNVNGVVNIADVTDLIDMLLEEPEDIEPLPLDSIEYKMIYVRSDTYMMGATAEQEPYASDNERAEHQVKQYPFYIGQTEVTQELWQAVMGYNPSVVKGKRLPVVNVTWNECQEFIFRLNRLTGGRYRLPTEAEWEFAARGGRYRHGYVYAGSNTLADVGWYDTNSGGYPHEVKTLDHNELGLYDMSGNVWEWCQDYWAASYSPDTVLNPLGPVSGTSRVQRGGSWLNLAQNCRVSTRNGVSPVTSSNTLGFRLAMDAPYESWFMLSQRVVYLKVGEQRSVDILNGNGHYTIYNGNAEIVSSRANGEKLILTGRAVGTTTVTVKDNLSGNMTNVIVIVYNPQPMLPDTLDGVGFNMIFVEGGIFNMGATSEQSGDAYSNETPVHQATLDNYYIGETEVTQALWQVVMGNNPSGVTGDLNRPVERVTWTDCLEFIDRLNDRTGKEYRLPSEAEWEFAARGGIFSQGFKYSGSDNIDDVAWYSGNSGGKSHAVRTKLPNELGVYDMSGNVFEWCQDWYAVYTKGVKLNPLGPIDGTARVNRGGGWSNIDRMARVSYRRSSTPASLGNNLGLRLAMDAPGTHRFGLSRRLVRMEVGEHRTLSIINGNGDYTYIHNTDIVSGEIDGETLLLTGLKVGTATVGVKDNLTGAQAFVTVIVTERHEPEIIPVLNDTIWMEYVKGGTFDMGGTDNMGSGVNYSQLPVHPVTLSSYFICNREVTQHLWYAVMGSNPSKFTAANGYSDDLYKPVESVSWEECLRFIARLNMLTGLNFRLPTEAEWEFAARGGVRSNGYRFAGSNNIDDVGWHSYNADKQTHHCRLKMPNELDLYDMTGNVEEWCLDFYSGYPSTPQVNPIAIAYGNGRICRGGAWALNLNNCHISYRGSYYQNSQLDFVGLRLAMDAEEVDKPDGPDGGGDTNRRLRLSHTVVTLEVGESKTVDILNGHGDYTVMNEEYCVLADVEGETLMLTGKAVGVEDVIVRDNVTQQCALVTAIVNKAVPVKPQELDDSVYFDMIYIPEGAFVMGDDAVPGAAPAHYVSLNAYYIGQTEVTNLMWRWVMDYPINWQSADLHKPVEGLSWDDCQDFIARLNEKTGREYRLPSEAEWEYAAMGAGRSRGYTYSGSNTVGDVAWYWDNLPSQQIATTGYGVQRVSTRGANEKEIYDMSGNVREWCQDWYGVYPMGKQINPTGPETGTDRVLRGGCYLDSSDPCRVKARSASRQSFSNYVGTGFRLAMDAVPDSVTPTPTPDYHPLMTLSKRVIRIPVGGQRSVDIYNGSGSYTLYNSNPAIATCLVDGEALSVTGLTVGTTDVKVVDNITFTAAWLTVIVYKPSDVTPPEELFNEPVMIYVPGGTFVRGATSEQGSITGEDELPLHQVTVSNYYISQTEVSQRLWQRVMGGNPSHFKGETLPVEQVTWEDCQEFIRRLNELTGRSYRMVTEAEWEYAARGGRLSNGYKYAGANTVSTLGWYKSNSGSTTHAVAQKLPNELNIYDMSGNVWEWCQDVYGPYSADNQFNPVGLDPEWSGTTTVTRVMRGGAWDGNLSDCRVARRLSAAQDYAANNVGLRLAMDGPQGAPLAVDPRVVELYVDEQRTVAIKNGTGDYTATGGGSIASFTLSGSSLTVKGLAVGTTTINILDNTTMARTVLTVIVRQPRKRDDYKTITFWIRYISGGAFDMGATDEQGSDAAADESPVHRVLVPSFGIGETEVTQELWQAVMGYNPSMNTGDLQMPVDNVTWEEAEQFVARLSDLCDKPYRLPTEAEWEYAARGGRYGSTYKYSGSNMVGKVAWYAVNSGGKTHAVGSLPSNNEYLYDMSGNVDEWCHDWYGPYSAEPAFDPEGPDTADYHVARGGRWDSPAASCRVSARSAGGFGETLPGVRIALQLTDDYWFGLSRSIIWLKVGGRRTVDIYNGSGSYTIYSSKPGVASYVVEGDQIDVTGLVEGRTVLQVMDNVSHEHKTLTVIVRNPVTPLPDDDDDEDDDDDVNGLLKMIYVRGGTFAMGATSEQGSDAASDEDPSHLVTLSNYYVSETEVTQALWKRVMGGNPSVHKGDNLPVEQVSWEDCQEFISRLNSLTGKQYRLLTEAEWEYAAQGGYKSKSYKYAGSNTVGNVAWYSDNSGSASHGVKLKTRNELGIYDMSGNVAEWCQDVYGAYSTDNQKNPVGAEPDGAVSSRVVRGGACDGVAADCRVSARASQSQDYRDGHIGLRLARDAANSGDDGLVVVTHRNVEIEVGESTTVGITGGSGNYVAAGGGGIVRYSLSGATLTLTGLAEGKTTVNVKDNTANVWTIITVTVTAGEIPYKYRNISFWIKYISGGAFTQGATDEQGTSAAADESPAHTTLVPAYGIGKYEVTQELWQAVMGYNPSVNTGNLQLPVDNVTWEEAQEFVSRLSDIFDSPFRLPTEAEWEYAARGARSSKGYKYAGGNSASTVAWYSVNSGGTTHPVGSKRANERSLYDMSGNVDEWCQDWYGPYSDEAVFAPMGPVTGEQHVARGGRWDSPAASLRVSARSAGGFGTSLPGLRVVLEHPYSYNFTLTRQTLWMEVGDNRSVGIHNGSGSYTISSSESGVVSYVVNDNKISITGLAAGNTILTVLDNVAQESKTITVTVTEPAGTNEPEQVDGAAFEMVYVRGGTFKMGGTDEQGSDAYSRELPVHNVTLNDFKISNIEVTQELWLTVMDSNPSTFTGDLQLPVDNVSWEDCQLFIARLNEKTGKRYRLPTEAEWEYAARGGSRSQGYKFAGGNTVGNVAWYSGNASSKTHVVGSKQAPNELGIHDMSGNVMEWCQDWYGLYGDTAQVNPVGPATGTQHSIRGGSWGSTARGVRVSYRLYYTPVTHTSQCGLRLVEDVDNPLRFGLSTTVLTMEPGQQADVAILNGSGDYTLDEGSEVVTCTLSGEMLTVTANAIGATTVSVTDNNTGENVILTVIVTQPVAPFGLSQSELTMEVGNTATVDILNGRGNYTVTASTAGIVTALIDGETLSLTAVKAGTTVLTVTDALTQSTATLTVTVTAPAVPLALSQDNVTMIVGMSTTVNILNGKGSYSVSGGTGIVSTVISGNTLTLQALATGTATVTVTDLVTGLTASLTVTVSQAQRGDVNCDGVIDENDYGELYRYLLTNENLLSFYTADVNADQLIDFKDIELLLEILYNSVMKSWNGYPFNDYLQNLYKYDINGDGMVSIADYNVIAYAALYGGYDNCDMNGDGVVNWQDVCIFHVVLMKYTGEWSSDEPQEHEYVDLGLPSGTLWATTNIGATKPEDYGDYFAWGETEPKETYDYSTYKWCNGSLRTFTKYCNDSTYGYNGFVDNKMELDSEDDAATVNWGTSWEMPSQEQVRELIDKCTWQWTTRNGVNGRLITGPNGNTLFLPAAGSRAYNSFYNVGSKGCYWSHSKGSYGPYYVTSLGFESGSVNWYSSWRQNGYSVRAVRASEPAPEEEEFTVNGVTFNMIKVDGGTFTMGFTKTPNDWDEIEDYYDYNDKPAHQVTLSGYKIGQTEVTQALWQAVMGSNPSVYSTEYGYTDGMQRPVESISWNECQQFILKLNALTGKNFRLPTEAEWEFAARGGIRSRNYIYAGGDVLRDVAIYYDYLEEKSTYVVASKTPNEIGLYDMSGNVWELCQDWFTFYSDEAQENPIGPSIGSYRVVRGGGWWYSDGSYPRVSGRTDNQYFNHEDCVGLRLALDLDDSPKFRFSQPVVTVEEGETKTVSILNGCGDYIVEGGSDYVTVTVSDNNLTIKGRYVGLSTVTVTDIASGYKAVVNVNVTEATSFRLFTDSITVDVGEQRAIQIFNGGGNYTVTGGGTIVKKLISDNHLLVTGAKTGTTTLTVKDISSGMTTTLSVTVVNDETKETFTVGDVKFTMIAVDGGTFMMGDDNSSISNQKPAHQVTLSSYCIGQTEVTQALWQAVMGINPSSFMGNPYRPVDWVSWNECQVFIYKLNQITGKQFRLLTEAEWEYAARGGNQSHGYNFAGSNIIGEVAWYSGNAGIALGVTNPERGTHEVATKVPNELGIYDMTGNVNELCQDWLDNYSSASQIDPVGAATGTYRIVRGGTWNNEINVTNRGSVTAGNHVNTTGLRLALDLNDSPKFRFAEMVVTVKVGQSKLVDLLNGNNNYTIECGTDIFAFSIINGKLNVTGSAVGTGTVTVTDTSTGASSVLTVIVTDAISSDHEYVDLGLPSGTLWATCNVGASAPEEYGDYFAWGETVPKDSYSWNNYKWCMYSNTAITKYCTNSYYGTIDNKTELELTDDAAYVNWGSSWRIPTKEQYDELRTKCSWKWISKNGVNGYEITGSNGNTLFLPAAGFRNYASLYSAGTYCYYWSCTLSSGRSDDAYTQYFYSTYVPSATTYDRFRGQSVRAVRVQ